MELQDPSSNGNLEQKEVEKYLKFFTIKSLQCVVDSRVGCLSNTRCNPTAKGLDWFNICLPDSDANRKCQNAIRELFGKKVPGLSMPVCIDIVLKTSEGSFTVLESWQVTTKTQVKEEDMKNHFSIYNRLGVLLKSVIVISRMLPSYQLSRRNDNDFLLFFKVHTEIYPLHHYELHNVMSVGSVVTPCGEISIKALYRNKIWLNAGSMYTNTYALDDPLTLFLLSVDKNNSDASFNSLGMFENEIALAVSDTSSGLREWVSSSSDSSEIYSAFKNLETRCDSTEKQTGQDDQNMKIFDGTSRPVPAFAEPFNIDFTNMPNLDLPDLPATPPFLSLLQDSPDVKVCSRFRREDICATNTRDETVTNETENLDKSVQCRAEAVGFEDDFVLVELRPAFCSDHDTVGSLFRQCQSPVALDMFAALEKEDRESETIDLETQLEKYRKDLRELENYFKALY